MKQVKCKRCGWEWTPRTNPPNRCSHCKSEYWDREKIKEKKDPNVFFKKRYGKFFLALSSPESTYKKGLTQKELRKWLEVSQGTISKVVNILKYYDLIYRTKERKYYIRLYTLVVVFFETIRNEVLYYLEKEKNKREEIEWEIKKLGRKDMFVGRIKKDIENIKKLDFKKQTTKNRFIITYFSCVLRDILFSLSLRHKISNLNDLSLNDIKNIFALNVLEHLYPYPYRKKISKKTFENIKKLIIEYQKRELNLKISS